MEAQPQNDERPTARPQEPRTVLRSDVHHRRYDVLKSTEWAIITIDHTGTLSIVSDYGNYGFKWSAFSGDFRKFLCDVENDYLLGKILSGRSRRDVCDVEATLKNIRQWILDHRRHTDISKEQAREEWTLLARHAGDFDSEVGRHLWYEDTRIDCAYEQIIYTWDPQAVMFCRVLWKPFQATLRAELDAEAGVVPANWALSTYR